MQFRLLRGLHHEGGKTFKPGDIIDSKTNLAERFNQPETGSIKFEPVQVVAPAQSEADQEDLSKCTVQQLREIAEANEIDLEGCTLKEEILNAVQGELSCQ
jgi:hypothetical protein